MKKIVFLLLLFCQIGISQTVIQNGSLQVKGVLLLNQHNEPIILRGMSFGWHNWWPRFYTNGTVNWLTNDWKCTVIRAAMGVEPDSGYLKRPEWSIETITPVIEAAIINDIYVIIDWHSHNLFTEQSKMFFGEMAKKYGDKPNIIYEIYNEPVKDSWSDVKNYSIEVIKEIRKYDTDNIILVGCPHWDQNIHLVADDPITGFENIMYTVHFYAGTHKQWLRDRADSTIQKGIPIFVSECGETEASGNGALDKKEWKLWQKWMDDNNISWCKWSIADKNETSCVVYPSANSEGNWKEKDLTPSGKSIRKQFIKYSKKSK